jgi:hypothetical protein
LRFGLDVRIVARQMARADKTTVTAATAARAFAR